MCGLTAGSGERSSWSSALSVGSPRHTPRENGMTGLGARPEPQQVEGRDEESVDHGGGDWPRTITRWPSGARSRDRVLDRCLAGPSCHARRKERS
jgi:hypothetical protein